MNLHIVLGMYIHLFILITFGMYSVGLCIHLFILITFKLSYIVVCFQILLKQMMINWPKNETLLTKPLHHHNHPQKQNIQKNKKKPIDHVCVKMLIYMNFGA